MRIENELDTLLLKVTITPLLMLTVSLTARRWGSFAGGILAGLPVTSGPISIYLALDHGSNFAAQAAEGSMSGLGAVVISYSAYLFSSRGRSIFYCIITTLSSYIASSTILVYIDSFVVSTIVIIAIIFVSIGAASGEILPHIPNANPPRWDMPLRMVSSIALVVGVTSCAAYLGPLLSGFLAPVPFVAWPLIVFSHVNGGRQAAVKTIVGTYVGAFSVISFNIVIAYYLKDFSVAMAYIIAFVSSAITSMVSFIVFRQIGSKLFSGRIE